MISLEKAKQWLESQEDLAKIEICKDTYLRAQFINQIAPDDPHHLVVHPIHEKLVLKVLVQGISKVSSRQSDLHQVLQKLNYDLMIGKVGTDSRDGEVSFEINHPCIDGAEEDPRPEVFKRLIEAAVSTAHEVAILATHVGMVEAGVPEAAARKFIDQMRAQQKSDDEEKDVI